MMRCRRRLLVYVVAITTCLAALAGLSAQENRAVQDEAQQQNERALWRAAHDGHLDAVKAIIAAGVPVDSPQRWGATALLIAAGAGQEPVVRYLLDQGADVDAVETFWGTTPLARAQQGKHFEVARLLLEQGARFDSQVFYQAVLLGEPSLVESMLAARTLYAYEREDALSMVRLSGPERTIELLEHADAVDELPMITLAPAQLDKYVGSYGREGADDVSFELEIRGGVLTLLGGAEPASLMPLGGRHFRTGEQAETAVFFLARAGVVDGFLLLQRGLPPAQMRRFEDAGQEIARSQPDAASPQDPTEPALAKGRRGSDRPWPSFRGPGASGVADGQGAIAQWDLETGHHVVFSVEVPGLGLSSPVVANGRVFLTTAVSEGDQTIKTGVYGDPASVAEVTEQDWRVLALDAESGELLWQKSIAAAVPGAQRHLKSSHANSTPVTDGERVVAVFPTAGLVALDAETGELLWRRELGALSSGTADGLFEWGFASSPILWRDTVILQVDVHGGSYIASWDLQTGEPRWRTERDEIPSWSTPTILEHGEHLELITSGTTYRGYNPKTGTELWSLAPNSEIAVATPVVSEGVAFLTSGYPPIRPIYALQAGARGTLQPSALLWSHTRGGGYMPTPIVYRGVLYMPHHNGRLVAYDVKNGETIYRARFSQRGALTGSPIAGDGLLFFPTEEGKIYVVEAGRTYRELAVHDMGEGIMTTPALSSGRLYIRTLERLWALGAPGRFAKQRR